LQENRAAQEAANNNNNMQLNPSNSSDPNAWISSHHHQEKLPPHTITLGLSLSRRHAKVGNKDTVTRQTAFDFNDLQDRSYKYVSSTDEYGWRAGGGESGGPPVIMSPNNNGGEGGDHSMNNNHTSSNGGLQSPLSQQPNNNKSEYYQEKIAAPDTVHIPIIQIPCRSEAEVDQVIHAREIFSSHTWPFYPKFCQSMAFRHRISWFDLVVSAMTTCLRMNGRIGVWNSCIISYTSTFMPWEPSGASDPFPLRWHAKSNGRLLNT
jgi:hypothetical protein